MDIVGIKNLENKNNVKEERGSQTSASRLLATLSLANRESLQKVGFERHKTFFSSSEVIRVTELVRI